MNNEQIVRNAYQTAEDKNIPGWVASFTPDGTFTDHSIGVTYRGPDGPNGLGATVEVYAKAFPGHAPRAVPGRQRRRRRRGGARPPGYAQGTPSDADGILPA